MGEVTTRSGAGMRVVGWGVATPVGAVPGAELLQLPPPSSSRYRGRRRLRMDYLFRALPLTCSVTLGG